MNTNDKTLREMVRKSVSEVQEYVYTLHREIDLLTNKILKEKSSSHINDEILRKLSEIKWKWKDHDLKQPVTNKSRK